VSEAEFVSPSWVLASICGNGSSFILSTHGNFAVRVHFTEGFGVTGELSAEGLDDEVSRHV
jgi:hypothetical protein